MIVIYTVNKTLQDLYFCVWQTFLGKITLLGRSERYKSSVGLQNFGKMFGLNPNFTCSPITRV